jgi:hypothetical protein
MSFAPPDFRKYAIGECQGVAYYLAWNFRNPFLGWQEEEPHQRDH